MHVLLAPDKFKGSLDATEVAEAIGRGIRSVSDAAVEVLPLADGGDGSVDAAAHAGFEIVPVEVHGATGRPVSATVAFDGRTAVVELANTCGLSTLDPLDPLGASTFGLGEAIAAALTLAPARIVIALGGSASTDGGTGMLAALGARFLDVAGSPLALGGGSLVDLASVEDLPDLSGVELVCATDVTNPLTGTDGAAAVFAPQKGATRGDVALLDSGLARLAAVTELDPAIPGAGAAGGAGFGCLLLGATIVSGANYFLDLLGFDERAARADLVVTGEGSLDQQTADGKLISVVARRSGSTPVVAVAGRSLLSADAASALGISRVYVLGDYTDQPTVHDAALSTATLERIGSDIARQYLSA